MRQDSYKGCSTRYLSFLLFFDFFTLNLRVLSFLFHPSASILSPSAAKFLFTHTSHFSSFCLSLNFFQPFKLHVRDLLISHSAFFQPFRVRVFLCLLFFLCLFRFFSSLQIILFFLSLSPSIYLSFYLFTYAHPNRPFSASFLFFLRDAFSLLPMRSRIQSAFNGEWWWHVIICTHPGCRRRLRSGA